MKKSVNEIERNEIPHQARNDGGRGGLTRMRVALIALVFCMGGGIGTLLSCDVGLGEAVDVNPPTVSFDYPPTGAVIREEFYIGGKWDDDKEIKEIQIQLIDNTKVDVDKGATGEVWDAPKVAEIVDEGKVKRWYLAVNTPYYKEIAGQARNDGSQVHNDGGQSSSDGGSETSSSVTQRATKEIDTTKGYNGYSLCDGKYSFKVTAIDKVGHETSTASPTFEIDNSKPFFIMSKPNVVIAASEVSPTSKKTPSRYGSAFKIQGTLFDEHADRLLMEITVFDEKGNKILYQEKPFTEENVKTAGGTDLKVAEFNNKKRDEESTKKYVQIYWDKLPLPEGDIGNTETKLYTCEINVKDDAKIYRDLGSLDITNNASRALDVVSADEASKSIGNKTTVVYTNDDVNNLTDTKIGLGKVASELSEYLNKTDLSSEEATKRIVGTLDGESATVGKVITKLNEKATDTSNENTRLYFSLNPNADPTYAVAGFDYDGTPNTIKLGYQGSTLTFVASAGLDGTPIKPNSFRTWIYNNKKAELVDLTDPTDKNKRLKPATDKIDELKLAVSEKQTELDSLGLKYNENKVAYDKIIGDIEKATGWKLLSDLSQIDEYKNSSSTDSVSIPVDLTADIAEITHGYYYYVVLTGCDSSNVDFKQDKVFSFKGQTSSTPPEFNITAPEELSYVKCTDDVVFSGTAKTTDVDLATLVLTLSAKSESKDTPEIADKLTVTATYNDDGTWKYDKKGLSIAGTGAEENGTTWEWKPKETEGYDKLKIVAGAEKLYLWTVDAVLTSKAEAETKGNKKIHIDTTKPVVKISSITPNVNGFGDEDEANKKTYVNGKIKFSGDINDNQFDNVRYTVLVDGKEEKLFANAETNLSFEKEIDTTKLTDDKEIKIIATAKDVVGNEGTFSSSDYNQAQYKRASEIVIKQETDRPVVTFTSVTDPELKDESKINAETNLFGKSGKILGNITDDDGISSVSVQYRKFKTSDPKDNWTTIFEKSNIKNVTYSLSALLQKGLNDKTELAEGIYEMQVIVRDVNYVNDTATPFNYKVTPSFVFGVDYADPEIKIATKSTWLKPGNQGISGTVTDASGVKSLYRKVSGGSDVQITVPANGGWSDSITVGNSGDTVTYEATDKFGKTSKAEFIYKVDTEKPKITEIVSSVSPYGGTGTDKDTIYLASDGKSATMTFTGKANDDDGNENDRSGLSKVQYVITNTTDTSGAVWQDAKNTTDWTATIDFGSGGTVAPGNKIVSFKCIDNAGNESDVMTKTVCIDTAKPQLSVTAIKIGNDAIAPKGGIYYLKSGTFEISGSATDTNFVSLVVGDDELSNASGNFAKSITREAGSQTLTLVATDKAGQRTENSISIFVDIEKPKNLQVDVSNLISATVAGTGLGQKDNYVNGIITVKASATDNDKIEKSEIQIWKGAVGTGTQVGTTDSEESSAITKTYDTTSWDDSTEYTIAYIATDRAENTETSQTTKIFVCQETDKPVATFSNAKTTVTDAAKIDIDTNLFDKTGNNKMLGSVTDDDGIKSILVECKKSGSATWETLLTKDEINTTTYSLTVPLQTENANNEKVALDEGVYDVKVTVKDINYIDDTKTPFNFKSEQFLIAVDDALPDIEVLTLGDGTSDVEYKSGMFVKSTIVAKGKALDASGIKSLCRKVPGSDDVVITVATDGSWTDTFSDAAGNDKTQKYVAVDTYGKDKTLEIKYSVDVNAPRFTTNYIEISDYNGKKLSWTEATSGGVNWFSTTSIRIKGMKSSTGDFYPVTDAEGNLDSITVTLGTGNDAIVSSVNLTGGSGSEFDQTIDLGDKTHIALVPVDRAGNEGSPISVNLQIDTVTPEVTAFTSDKQFYSGDDIKNQAGVTLTVTASDNIGGSGVKKIVLKKPNGTETTYDWAGQLSAGSTTDATITIQASDIIDGQNVFTVSVIDDAGNRSVAKSLTIASDINPPRVSITEPYSNPSKPATINKTITLKGRAQDENGIKTASGKVQYRIGTISDSNVTWGAWTDDNAASLITPDDSGDWTYNFDTFTKVTDATVKQIGIRVIFSDNSGNDNRVEVASGQAALDDNEKKAITAFLVDQNKDRPIIKLSNILVTDSAISTKTVNGTISDDDGDVQGLWYWNEGGSGSASSPLNTPPTVANDNGWTKITVDAGTGAWKVELADDADTSQKWYFYAIDAIENGFATKQNGSGGNKLQGIYLKDAKTPQTGSGSEGREVEKVEFSYDTVLPVPTLYFMGKEAGVTVSLTDTGWKDASEANVTFGANAKLWAKVEVAENAAMKATRSEAVRLKLGDAVITDNKTAPDAQDVTKNPHEYKYLFGPIDLGTYNSGVVKLTTDVTDLAGLSNTATINIIVDKNAPQVSIIYPEAKIEAKITSSIELTGTVIDDLSSVKSMKWAIPPKTGDVKDDKSAASSIAATQSYWHDMTSLDSSKWKINFPSANRQSADCILWYVDNKTNYLIEESGEPNVYKVPIWFKVSDSVDNEGIIKNLFVYADPDAGKPTAKVLSPDTGTHTSGSINIFGTAIDTDGSIQKVELKITGYNDEASANAGTGGNERFNGVVPDGKESWRYSYNSSDYNDKILTIQAKATDNGNNSRDWTKPIFIYIDPNTPIINSARLVRYGARQTSGQAKVSLEYQSDMYISGLPSNIADNGEWYLELDVTNKHGPKDASGNPTATAGDGDLTKIQFNKQGSGLICDDWPSEQNVPSGKKDYIFRFKITTAGKNGLIYYKVTIWNQNSSPVSVDLPIRINVDSASPTVFVSADGTGYEDNMPSGKTLRLRANPPSDIADARTCIGEANDEDKIVNSNKWFTIGDEVKEKASGLDFVAVSFVGDRNGTKKVYQPMVSGGNTTPKANETVISTATTPTNGNVYINADGLPALYLTGVSRTADTIAANAISGKNQIHKNSLVKIAGKYYFIKSVSGQTATLTEEVPVSQTTVEFIYAQVVDNQVSETQDASGNVEASTDDGDGMWEEIRVSGENYKWKAMFDSKNIPDGPVTVKMIAVDKAGNLTKGSVSTQVQNNRPRIAKVLLGTDLNGDNKFGYDSETDLRTDQTLQNHLSLNEAKAANKQSFGEFNYYSTLSALGEALDTATLDSDDFKVVGNLCIIPEFVGGNNSIKYILKDKASATDTEYVNISSSTTVSTMKTKAEIIASCVKKGTLAIDNQVSDFGGIICTPQNRYLAITFWDATEGLVQGTTSQKAFLQIPIADPHDAENPTAKITPFYWKSRSDNSVHKDSDGNLLGHIELEQDLPTATFNASSGEMDRDPKVSGKIKIEGELRDNIRLGSITMSAGNFSNFTNKNLANYTNGNWVKTADASSSTTGIVSFEISDVSITQAGHKAKYTIVLDTEKVTGVAKADCAVTVTAQDWQSNTSPSSTTQTTVTYDASGNISTDSRTPYYKMDVVPYITGIETKLSSIKKKNPSVYNRTALGHYPVGKDETAVQISGFNLKGGTVTNTGSSSTESNGVITLNVSGSSSMKSGALSVKVNTIETLNNKNNDNAKGNYNGTVRNGNYSDYNNYCYNRLPNNDNNDLLTDDVLIDVWDFKSNAAQPISGAIEQPIMHVNPSTGRIGFAFANGPLYFSMPNTSNSYEYWMGSYDFFTSVGFAYDSLGHSYACAAGGDINSEEADRFVFMTDRWGTNETMKSQKGSYEAGANGSGLRIEAIGRNVGGTYEFNKQRVKSPSFATAVHGTATNVYLAYYDAMADQIKLRYGKISSTSKANFDRFVDLGASGTPPTDSTTNVSLLAGGTGNAQGHTGQYVSIAVKSSEGSTDDDVVVAVWYDETENQLLYTYTTDRNNAVAGNNTTRNGWATPQAIFSGKEYDGAGEFCQIAVDKNGGVHIAAYDTSNADLVYAYATKPEDTFKTCIVDSSGVVGANITLETALNDNNKAVPYIGYYATSCGIPKYAYFAGNDIANVSDGAVEEMFTKAWECAIVPTPSNLYTQSTQGYNKINVGVWKDASGKMKASTTGTDIQSTTGSGYGSSSSGTVYGNGSKTAVLGYAVKNGSNSTVETAQMR